jgi:uncharacterized cupin superfamily protein
VMNRGDSGARVLMVSEMNAPELVVYPDSNKAGLMTNAPGSPLGEDDLKAWLSLDEAVDYWHGEQPPDPA